MRCLDGAEIARAASGAYHRHLGTCIPCCLRVEQERALHARLRALPVPALSSTRRAELGAELLATVALARPRRSVARRWTGTAALGGIAAALAVGLAWQGDRSPRSPRPPPVAGERVSRSPELAPIARPRVRAPSVAAASIVAHERAPAVDEAPHPRPSERAKAPLSPPRARVQIATEREVTAPVKAKGERTEDALDTSSSDAMVRFREGWLALRAGRHLDAIAHFDRVIDPVAREEALYWAVVAAHRTGDVELAVERLARFRAAFPKSEYLAQFDRRR